MKFEQALAYLLSLGHETLTIKLGLKNTETLLAALGNPQREFFSIQIAGTNGKGSTAAMLAAICRSGGVQTGLFTSPHLISITERIKIDGEPIAEQDFADLTDDVRNCAQELVAAARLEALPTFFEHVTAIALLAFRKAKVQLAVLETGLGGRLDSTTAAGAGLVALTPIAMDHQEYLGSSLAEIAAEKAAIIRPEVTAIIAPQRAEALEAISRRCELSGVKPILISEKEAVLDLQPHAEGINLTVRTAVETYHDVRLSLRGRHQIVNALVAIALAEALRVRGFAISRQAIVEGLETAAHPGRLELWESNPPVLFDGAHNPAAACVLRDYLDEFIQAPFTIIFGAMQDKPLSEMMSTLFPLARTVILTGINNPRAATLEDLKAATPKDTDVRCAASVWEAWRQATEVTGAKGLICVTGSLYLIGEMQKTLCGLRKNSFAVRRQTKRDGALDS